MTKRKSKVLWGVVLLGISVIFIFSLYQIIDTISEYAESAAIYDKLTEEIVKSNDTDVWNDEKENISAEIEVAPISVDFNALLEQNKDVIGWIYCENTPINYPVLQSEDNNYYLRRMINQKYNIAGSVFMDYRCQADLSRPNTIIYGHNMKNDTMFGTFTDYNEQAYYDEHPILWLLTPVQDYKIELIAGYVTPSTSDVYKDFYTEEELKTHIEDSVKKSTFVSIADIASVDRIVTLSTCSYEYSTARYVLIGSVKPLNDECVKDE